jgi:hypothetical protein
VLEPRLVGDIDGVFCVPRYQRGYRWGVYEVRRLLDDIWESNGSEYYLQPVVVKPLSDGRWELIDGQQRLTTLFLAFEYMRREGLQNSGATYAIEYETRPGSRDYLRQLDPDLSTTNIDYLHMWRADEQIDRWFAAHGPRRQWAANKLYGYLFESVRVIWYQAPDELGSEDLFTRLNVGRIPLTDAELVKALILARSRGDSTRTDRPQEIVAQWDTIERDLRAPEVWAFVTGKDSQEATHISLLLDTIAGGPIGRERPSFHTFETLRPDIDADPQSLWDRVVDMHSAVLGWYDDRDLFHKIGYLVATGTPFRTVLQLAQDHTKSKFEAMLDGEIAERIDLKPSDLRDLTYFSSRKCTEVLLLMNAETVRRRTNSHERYSFRTHASGAWSLEHIHAQSAETLNRAEQWVTWLRLHRDALQALPDLNDELRESLTNEINAALPNVSEPKFRSLEARLVELFSDADDTDLTHSIFNLALLTNGDNSALSNSAFEVKRQEILRRDQRGAYIPVCTRNVFLKYYTRAKAQHLHFWGADDREGYELAMLDILGDFLKPEPRVPS